MIELDLLSYLRAHTALTALVGDNIFLIQAPTDKKMPWLVLEISSGLRKRITNTYTEETAFARITVDVGPSQTVLGRQIIEAALRAVENYRGLLGASNDVIVSCGAVRSWAGYSEVNRFQFDATIRLIETTQYPT
jgi:hypothetical protein